jgi:hypothetical protein
MTERKFLYYLMLYLVVSIGNGIMHIYCLYIHPLIADTLGREYFPIQGSRRFEDFYCFLVRWIHGYRFSCNKETVREIKGGYNEKINGFSNVLLILNDGLWR